MLSASGALAQMSNPCGAPLSLENAQEAASAAVAAARKNDWTIAVGVTYIGGAPVYFEDG